MTKKPARKTPKPRQKKRACRSCRFARPLEGNDEAIECRRYPPRVTTVVGNQVASHCPLLGKQSWCGEYRPNP